jgi:hypothetical protein
LLPIWEQNIRKIVALTEKMGGFARVRERTITRHARVPKRKSRGPNYPTFTGTRVIVSLPKMSITFTATV